METNSYKKGDASHNPTLPITTKIERKMQEQEGWERKEEEKNPALTRGVFDILSTTMHNSTLNQAR